MEDTYNGKHRRQVAKGLEAEASSAEQSLKSPIRCTNRLAFHWQAPPVLYYPEVRIIGVIWRESSIFELTRCLCCHITLSYHANCLLSHFWDRGEYGRCIGRNPSGSPKGKELQGCNFQAKINYKRRSS